MFLIVRATQAIFQEKLSLWTSLPNLVDSNYVPIAVKLAIPNNKDDHLFN